MLKQLTIISIVLCCYQSSAIAQSLSATKIQQLTAAQAPDALALYKEYLALPNDANFPDDIAQLASWLRPQFEQRGFIVTQIDTPGSPLLLAERHHGADTTALVYLQADGQPVDPTAWSQPNPFAPVMKMPTTGEDGATDWEIIEWPTLSTTLNPDWRVFARSASDSKGPNIQFLSALDNLAKANVTPDFNLKVIIDLEEEQGSPNLPAAVIANRDLLAADMLLIFDGPPHASGEPTLVFGARGIATITLTAYGAKVPQHSGHYGNYAPNPAWHLSRILSSMKTANGRVSIPGFYDGIKLTDDVRRVLNKVPDDEPAIRSKLGFSQADSVAPTLQESLQYPSLNIRGLQAAWVGNQARTIIPATAVAEIDMRLVKESKPKYLLELINNHISNLGYLVLDSEPTDIQRQQYPHIISMTSNVSYAAYRTDFDSMPGRLATAALKHLNGSEPIQIRTSGGSIPISPFVDTLGVPAVSVPTVNIDNNQHSPNENLRLGDFIEGIATITAVLAQPLN